ERSCCFGFRETRTKRKIAKPISKAWNDVNTVSSATKPNRSRRRSYPLSRHTQDRLPSRLVRMAKSGCGWGWYMSDTLRTAVQLSMAGLIQESDMASITRVASSFAVAISPQMRALIDPNAPNDPIAAQFVPSSLEANLAPEELDDPIGGER